MQVKDHVVHQSSVHNKSTKISQHALNVPVFSVEYRHYTGEDLQSSVLNMDTSQERI